MLCNKCKIRKFADMFTTCSACCKKLTQELADAEKANKVLQDAGIGIRELLAEKDREIAELKLTYKNLWDSHVDCAKENKELRKRLEEIQSGTWCSYCGFEISG